VVNRVTAKPFRTITKNISKLYLTMPSSWTHLIRFIAQEDGQIHLGQVDSKKYPDVGLATYEGKNVEAKLVTGSIFDGVVTERVYHVAQVCCSSLCQRHGAVMAAPFHRKARKS